MATLALFTYAWVSRLLLLPMLAWLWWRGRRETAYRLAWSERLGVMQAQPGPMGGIWLHAASVGEIQALLPLIDQLLLKWPAHSLLISTQTPAGQQALRARWGEQLCVVYAPLDTPGSVRRWLDRWQPRLLVLIERELWPNTLAECRARALPVIVVNARLSERSAAQYRKWPGLMRPIWSQLAMVVAADPGSAQRFAALGVRAERLTVAGNLKFDTHTPTAAPLPHWPHRQGIVLGSSHAQDEDMLLALWPEVFAQHPDWLLVLVPRHRQRFEAVAQRLRNMALPFERSSEGLSGHANTQIVLVDEMGQLSRWYNWAQVACIGGTWAPLGGHNPLEALALGKPVVHGPHTHNAASLFAALGQAGLGVCANTPHDIWQALGQWLGSQQALQLAQHQSQTWMAQHQGASARSCAAMASFMGLATTPNDAAVYSHRARHTRTNCTIWSLQPEGLAPEWFETARHTQPTAAAPGSGRGQALLTELHGTRVVLRHYHRGGLLAHLLGDWFWGRQVHAGRAMREFVLLRHLRSLGLPVPRPLAARHQQQAWGYRCDIAVGWIADSHNLVECLSTRSVSHSEWQALGHAIGRLHNAQVFHADLNAHNLLLDAQGQAWVVDFDKCRLRSGDTWKAANLARLRRSLHKERQHSAHLAWTEANWSALLLGYHAASSAAH